MLTLQQVERLIDAERYEQLLLRVLGGGRCPAACGPELMRACTGPGLAPAALGFALQRMTELSYAPWPSARTPAARLIGLQRPDGLWGKGPASVAPSAIALRGLLDFDHQLVEFHVAPLTGLDACIDRAARALASLQRADGAIGRRSLDSAAVLWQLGASHMWLPIRFFDLRRTVERAERETHATHPGLHRLARAAAA